MKIEKLRQSQLGLLIRIQGMMKDHHGEIVPLRLIIKNGDPERTPVQIQLSVQRLYKLGWLERPVYGGYRLTKGAEDRIKEVLGTRNK